jgi:hypothetical protein
MTMKTDMRKQIITGGRTLLCALLLAGTLTGCLKNYGSVKLEKDIVGMFVDGRVPANYKYYYNGRDTMPYAIVGIKPEYRLVSKFWTPVPPNTDAFRKMARNAWIQPPYDTPVAGYLMTPEDAEIGLWYSYYPWATIKMDGTNAVSIYSPYKPGGAFNSN